MCSRIPIIGAVPYVIRNGVEGVFDSAIGMVRAPCSDAGAQQMRQGLIKIRLIPFTLLRSFFNCNPCHPKIVANKKTVGTTIESFFDDKIYASYSGVMKRIYALVAIPSLLVARVIDAAIGSIALLFAIVTAGMSKTLNYWAFSHFDSAMTAIQDVPVGLVRMIRPDATFFYSGSFNNSSKFNYYYSVPVVSAGRRQS